MRRQVEERFPEDLLRMQITNSQPDVDFRLENVFLIRMQRIRKRYRNGK